MKIATMLFLLLGLVSQASAVQCINAKQDGCVELLLISGLYDENNPIHRGLNTSAASQEERQVRVESLGSKIWADVRSGNTKAAPGTFLVFIWNANVTGIDTNVVGFEVLGRNAQKTSPEVVPVGIVVTPPKAKGYDAPNLVYRLKAGDTSTSVLLPWSMITDKTMIVICREGKDGVYPNTVSAKQGHRISPETLGWYKLDQTPNKYRVFIPFLSMSVTPK